MGNREATAAKRHKYWRKDWERMPYWPEYDSDARRWSILPLTMLAVHEPSRAVFELDYDRDHLLCSVKFLSRHSEAPSRGWQPSGPQMRELVRQITELYPRRW
jgi:hypothetical protein